MLAIQQFVILRKNQVPQHCSHVFTNLAVGAMTLLFRLPMSCQRSEDLLRAILMNAPLTLKNVFTGDVGK